MRKNFGAKPLSYPQPVFIIATYGEDGTPDAMNAAWGGIHDTNQIGVCIDPSHKTAKNLLAKKAFTVSIGDAAHVVQCDFAGLVSGNKEPDKMAKSGLHTRKAEFVDAPVIVNVSTDERILGDDGKIDPEKFEPITFDPVHHLYRKLGPVVGTAFQDGRKLI